ncbi:O-antigen ligase family protein [Sphingomonas sp. RHCKR47]|uniref:O-antigen ligase family protein n=1 Tax=Sphingomonas citricola TaxID=2862498 RepID=UPI001C685E86|nr:O-antigen ligase family protein [Sphingomonas citricola]MBW6525102.1 O-antigen ligase family protein [Sphingomonas citricola]
MAIEKNAPEFRSRQKPHALQFIRSYVALLATFGLFITFGAYRNVIVGYDYATDEASGSIITQAIVLSGSFLVGFALLATNLVNAATIFRRAAPLYVLPLFVLASALWSTDPSTTLARGVILVAVYVSSLGVVSYFGRKATYSIFTWVGGGIVVLSIFTALVFPSIGVHQTSDAVQSVHAGEWRGVLGHRTGLGQFSAIFIVFLVALRRQISGVWLLPLLCSALTCLYMAQSTGAFLTCGLGLAAFFLLGGAARLGALLFKTTSTALLALVWSVAALTTSTNISLLNLIGKTSDLTGRTALWQLVRQSLENNWVFGLGYKSGFQSISETAVFNKAYSVTPNSQSAYLDMYVAFGMVGLVFILLSWWWISLLEGGRLFLAGRFDMRLDQTDANMRVFCVVLVLILAQISIAESFYMESNNPITGLMSLLLPAGVLPTTAWADQKALGQRASPVISRRVQEG